MNWTDDFIDLAILSNAEKKLWEKKKGEAAHLYLSIQVEPSLVDLINLRCQKYPITSDDGRRSKPIRANEWIYQAIIEAIKRGR